MPVPAYPSDEPEPQDNPNEVIDSIIDRVIGDTGDGNTVST